MGAPAWTDDEKERLKVAWFEPGSLKAIAAAKFPGRTSDGLKNAAMRLGLPVARGNLKYQRGLSPFELAIFNALEQHGALTCYEIEAAGVAKLGRAQAITKRWHENKLCHIVDWRRRCNDGQWAPAWKYGPGIDKPRPARKTPSQLGRERYARAVGLLKRTNPFAVALGIVQAPETTTTGRVIAQSMDVDEWVYKDLREEAA